MFPDWCRGSRCSLCSMAVAQEFQVQSVFHGSVARVLMQTVFPGSDAGVLMQTVFPGSDAGVLM